jgi:hypothetical protein
MNTKRSLPLVEPPIWRIFSLQSAWAAAVECVSACNNGCGSLCVQLSDETGAEKIEVGTPVHLAFHELELRDLSLGLTVGPRLGEG